jgi:endo-1,4-beta-xylanase
MSIARSPGWIVAAGLVLWMVGLGQAQETPTAAKSLRQAAGQRMLIGTAIMSQHLDDPRHAALIAEQFDSISPGNEMKPASVQNIKGRFTFEGGDKIVAFAQAHDMQVIGHTLLWHEQSPRWLFQGGRRAPLSREEALKNMEEHITAVVSHYKGKVKGWDVVNEAIPDGKGELRDTPAFRAIGADYVVKAFEFAHAADPDVELYYNDYNIELDYKRDRALRLVRQIRDAGVRIDGVGIQGHYMLSSPPVEEIERGIKAYIDAGFKVMVTEFDVDPLPREGRGGADLSATQRSAADPYKKGFPPEMQQKLADRYRKIFQVLVKYPQVTRVTFWGSTDENSWLNNYPVWGRTNHAMLWDRRYQPKPAFDAVYEVLKSTAAQPKN